MCPEETLIGSDISALVISNRFGRVAARSVGPGQLSKLLLAKIAAGGRHACRLVIGRIVLLEGRISSVSAGVGEILDILGLDRRR